LYAERKGFTRMFPKALKILLLIGIFLLVTGAIDLDWMIVENHFQMWNATKDTWEFCPFLTMNWWIAYIFSLVRIVIGCLIIGYCLGRDRNEH